MSNAIPTLKVKDQKNKADIEGKIVNENYTSIEEPKYDLVKGQTHPTGRL